MSKKATIKKEEKKKEKLAKKASFQVKKIVKEKKKKIEKNIFRGIVNGKFSFNNTILSLSKTNGEVLKQHSNGSIGFKNTRKSTPFAAQKCAETMIKTINDYQLSEIEIAVKGIGSGRDVVIKRLLGEKTFAVTALIDKTPIRHGGCRPRKSPRK